MIRTFTIYSDGTYGTDHSPDGELHNFLNGTVAGYLEAVSGPHWCCFVNEEGKLRELPWNPLATLWIRENGGGLGTDDWIAGHAVFAGPPDGQGETTSVPTDIERKLAEWCVNFSGYVRTHGPDRNK